MKKIINKQTILTMVFLIVLTVVLYCHYAPNTSDKEICHAKNCTNYAADGEIYCEDHLAVKIVRPDEPAWKSHKPASNPSSGKKEDSVADKSSEAIDNSLNESSSPVNGSDGSNESFENPEKSNTSADGQKKTNEASENARNLMIYNDQHSQSVEESDAYQEGFYMVTEELTYDVVRYKEDTEYRAGVDDGIDLLLGDEEFLDSLLDDEDIDYEEIDLDDLLN